MTCDHEDSVYRGTERMNRLEFRGSGVKNFVAERVKYRCLKCGEYFTEFETKGNGRLFTTHIFPDDEEVEMRVQDL